MVNEEEKVIIKSARDLELLANKVKDLPELNVSGLRLQISLHPTNFTNVMKGIAGSTYLLPSIGNDRQTIRCTCNKVKFEIIKSGE